jgi:hypothetical protein
MKLKLTTDNLDNFFSIVNDSAVVVESYTLEDNQKTDVRYYTELEAENYDTISKKLVEIGFSPKPNNSDEVATGVYTNFVLI